MSVDHLRGCLLGTAVGDALGLPYEGLPPGRAAAMFPQRDRYHLLPGRGMVSDDTEHICMTAQALIESRGDAALFARCLARRLRWWLLGFPAGIGLATLRSIGKLWIGAPPESSGVFSAGNGPAMRSAILGIYFRNNFTSMRQHVLAATRITHTDSRAFWGALAVALAAAMNCTAHAVDGEAYYAHLADMLPEPEAAEFLRLVRAAVISSQQGEGTREFAAAQGLERGVSGYMLHTVPVAIHAWLSAPDDLGAGLLAVIACGGDTDTTAAIVGGIVGGRVGKAGISAPWLDHLWEWPRSVAWMERLGQQLADPSVTTAPGLPPAGVLLRNFIFLGIVLLHGVRRGFPPYSAT